MTKSIGSTLKDIKMYQKAIDEHAIVVITDVAGKIVFVNDKFCEISGYSQDELIGQDHRIVNSGYHSIEFFKDMWHTILAGKKWSGQIQNRAKDGSIYWVQTTITPILDNLGNVIQFMAVRTDITKEKIAQEVLFEKQTYLDLALAGSELGIWDWYLEDNSVRFDRRWAEMLGLNIDEIKMELSTWEERVHPDDLANCYADIKAYMNGETDHYKNIHRMKHANGEWVYILDQGKFSDFNEKGEPIRFTGTHLDITAQKKQEEKLKEAKMKAEEAERSKAHFLANMSHEIRTPMNAVLGMVQILQDSNLDEKQKEMLEIIQSSGENLLSIINDILDVSKIESGKLELERTHFNIETCVKESISLLKYLADQKNIKLEYVNNLNTTSWLFGDITRIRQILVNLINNSIKFTNKGSVKVEVQTKEIDEKKLKLLIKVIDSGVGIPVEAKEKLFKAFTQADSSVTRKFGGTGLGLTICMQLVHLMGGNIHFESELGLGTTFFVEIPVEIGEQVKEIPKLDKKTDKEFALLHPHKILVVEDSSVNQKIAKMMLAKLGYNCDIASNGLEAISALENNKNLGIENYSFIFMDMQMPEMDGITATKEINEKYQENAPVIVAMTANAFAEDKQKCLDAGMRDHVAKPIQIEHLKRVLIAFNNNLKKAS